MPAVQSRSKSIWGWVTGASLLLLAAPRLDGADFRRGDANGDGFVDLGDAVSIVAVLHGVAELSCERAGDADGDGTVDFDDVVVILNWFHRGGTPPPAPGPFECGPGPDDALSCESYSPAVCTSPFEPGVAEGVSVELVGPSRLSRRDHEFVGFFDIDVRLCSDLPIQAWQFHLALEGCSVSGTPGWPAEVAQEYRWFSSQDPSDFGFSAILDFDPPFDGQTLVGCHSLIRLTVETETAPSSAPSLPAVWTRSTTTTTARSTSPMRWRASAISSRRGCCRPRRAWPVVWTRHPTILFIASDTGDVTRAESVARGPPWRPGSGWHRIPHGALGNRLTTTC